MKKKKKKTQWHISADFFSTGLESRERQFELLYCYLACMMSTLDKFHLKSHCFIELTNLGVSAWNEEWRVKIVSVHCSLIFISPVLLSLPNCNDIFIVRFYTTLLFINFQILSNVYRVEKKKTLAEGKARHCWLWSDWEKLVSGF